MPEATITAAYVNPPKANKKRWTIKDDKDILWGAMPDLAKSFQQGGTYKIKYREETFQGNLYRVVESVEQVAAPTPAASGGHVTRPTTSKADARHIAVIAMLKSFIEHGQVQLDPEAIANAINVCVSGYHRSSLCDKQNDGEMNDEIPF